MRWLKFQKSHRTSRALPICGNALSHLAIIIESSSQKDDYHNRHIKRSPGRGLFSEQCSRQNGGKQRGATSEKVQKAIFCCVAFFPKRSARTESSPKVWKSLSKVWKSTLGSIGIFSCLPFCRKRSVRTEKQATSPSRLPTNSFWAKLSITDLWF